MPLFDSPNLKTMPATSWCVLQEQHLLDLSGASFSNFLSALNFLKRLFFEPTARKTILENSTKLTGGNWTNLKQLLVMICELPRQETDLMVTTHTLSVSWLGLQPSEERERHLNCLASKAPILPWSLAYLGQRTADGGRHNVGKWIAENLWCHLSYWLLNIVQRPWFN